VWLAVALWGCGGGGGGADPCEPNPCAGLHKTACLEVGGQARCMCDLGYVEDAGGDCVLAGGCEPNPCREEHRTRCVVQEGGATCLCDLGYVTGAGGSCVPDPCAPNPCQEVGRTACEAIDGAAVCRCDPGWIPQADGSCAPVDPCLPNPCVEGHRTRCVPQEEGVICLCASGYLEDGQGGCARPCELSPCQTPPRTRCANIGERAVCLCDLGYLENAQGVCVDDPCEPNPCQAERERACVPEDPGFRCACDPGYTREGPTCSRAASAACSAGSWCLEHPAPTTDDLLGVWVHDAQNALAVGEAGHVLHWDGADARALAVGTWLDVNAVDGRSLSNIWAVGQDGLVLHYDGEAWSSLTPAVDPPVRTALRAVWVADSQRVHLAGDGGVWLFYDGRAWARLETGFTQGAIHDLWGSGPYDVWATADFGRLLHFDGLAVDQRILKDTENLYGLEGLGPEELVVSTSNGRLVGWDGQGFEPLTGEAGMAGVLLTSLWGDGRGGYYASGFDILGGAGMLLRWDGATWADVWEEPYGFVWRVSGFDDAAALAVGAAGSLVRAAPGQAPEQLLQGRRRDLRAVAQRPDGEVFACGLRATLLVRGALGWSEVAGVPGGDFFDLVFAADGTGYLAASAGHLLRWDGATFSSLTDADHNGQADAAMRARQLRALWQLADGQLLVVGDDGLAGLWDGQAWVARDLPGTEDDLYDVWGSSAEDMWAVGQNLGVYHHDGNGWRPVSVPRAAGLADNAWYHGVWGSGPEDVTIVGQLGTVLRLQGANWSLEPRLTQEHLSAVLGLPDGTRWAVGAGGAILRADGAGGGWVRAESGTRADLWALGLLADGALVAVGRAGAVLHHAP